MPGKSKRGKGKRPQYRNQARQQTSHPAADANGAAAPAAASITSAPAAASARAPRGASAKTAVYSPATKEQYPFFTSELKRIVVITAVILVILIVLAVVLK